jgi:hypothetical protein
MRGYGQSDLDEAERLRRRLYNLYLALVIVVETVYREHTDTEDYDFARVRLTETMALLGLRAR